MEKETLQAALAQYFAPWVQALGLRAESFDAESVTLRLPQSDSLSRVGGMLCGGNIDPLLLAAIIERGMVRAGRLARIKVSVRDIPGSLAKITATVADAGANIDEVHHQRAFTMLSAQNVEIELVIQTRGRDHIQGVLDALHAGGFAAQEQ